MPATLGTSLRRELVHQIAHAVVESERVFQRATHSNTFAARFAGPVDSSLGHERPAAVVAALASPQEVEIVPGQLARWSIYLHWVIVVDQDQTSRGNGV